jgi:hypothetical protein
MVAYLLKGDPKDALAAIEGKLGKALNPVAQFASRAHRLSQHDRTVPTGKAYPKSFTCHHLVMAFVGLARMKAMKSVNATQ